MCPYVSQDEPINENTVPFLKCNTKEQYYLEPTHNYYYEIQGQLLCTGAKDCTLIVCHTDHKGSNVQDLFARMDVTVTIPAFFKKRNIISGRIILSDRKVSSKRVHIERIIDLGKTYNILTNPLNSTEIKLSSHIT
jgi:hypothetical protein